MPTPAAYKQHMIRAQWCGRIFFFFLFWGVEGGGGSRGDYSSTLFFFLELSMLLKKLYGWLMAAAAGVENAFFVFYCFARGTVAAAIAASLVFGETYLLGSWYCCRGVLGGGGMCMLTCTNTAKFSSSAGCIVFLNV